MLKYILLLAAGYLLGSISSAVILSRYLYKTDVRTLGSGNAGATNAARVYGMGMGLATLVCDGLKTAASMYLGLLLGGEVGFALAGAACVVGHCWPVFFRFRGGKGVICHNINGKYGKLCGIAAVNEDEDVMLITNTGTIIRTRVDSINTYSRTAGGVTVMRVAEGTSIVGFTPVAREEEKDEEQQEADAENASVAENAAETQNAAETADNAEAQE